MGGIGRVLPRVVTISALFSEAGSCGGRARAWAVTPRQSRDIGAEVHVVALLPDRMDNLPASAGSWSRSVGVAAAADRNLRLCG